MVIKGEEREEERKRERESYFREGSDTNGK